MTFSSTSFLFLFFPLVFLSYFVIKNRTYRNTVLLVFSLVFYAWGEPRLVVLMLVTVLIGYVLGLLTERFPKCKKLFLVLSLTLSLGFASGAMLYVVFGEILPQAILMYHSKLPAFSAIAGMLLGLFIIFA